MDEFLDLYLTGKRAEDLKKFRRFRTVIGLLGALFALIPVFIDIFGAKNAPLAIAFTALGFLLESAAALLSFVQKKFVGALVELENAAIEIEKQGEERENYQKLYAAWRETFGKRDIRAILSAVFTVFGFAALAAAVLLSTYLELPDYFLPLACIAAAVIAAIPSVLKTTAEGRARTRLYELAGREIDEIKRTKYGISERKILSQSENARSFSYLPVSVDAFLKEQTEKEDFRSYNKRSGIIGFLLGFVLGVGVIIAPILPIWEEIGPALSWTFALVTIFLWALVFFAFMLPLEAKKRDIYRRNYEKLTNSRSDALRRELQGAWIRQQRGGNIMFLCFLLAPLLFGLIYGIVGYALGHELNIIVAIGTSFMALLIPAAIISLIVWIIMYAVYRRRVRPMEAELIKISEEERRNGREG